MSVNQYKIHINQDNSSDQVIVLDILTHGMFLVKCPVTALPFEITKYAALKAKVVHKLVRRKAAVRTEKAVKLIIKELERAYERGIGFYAASGRSTIDLPSPEITYTRVG